MTMAPGRSGTILLVAAFTAFAYAFAIAQVPGQTTDAPSMSVVEAAKAVAHTIDANTPKSSSGPIAFLSATAHDNVVEVQFAVKDAAFFASQKAKLDDSRLALTRFYCAGRRVQFFNMGGVVRQITLAPHNSDHIEITIDQASCANLANLPVAKLADPESLARIAQAVATRELAGNSTSKVNGPFQLNDVASHDGVVEERLVVTDVSVAQNLKAKPQPLIGFATGFLCNRYGNELSQGLSIHQKFALADGSPVADFTIDRSSCGF